MRAKWNRHTQLLELEGIASLHIEISRRLVFILLAAAEEAEAAPDALECPVGLDPGVSAQCVKMRGRVAGFGVADLLN